ncbi:hypothetical protein JL720_17139 [Aureococcus anophagefferens]|nr:hypothetical protein JL720_17139 [Aureococcus anophagefferens]
MGSVLSGEADKVSLTKARRLCENAGRSWDDAWSAMFFAARTDLLEALRAEEIAALAPAPAAAEDVDVADAGDVPEADPDEAAFGGGEEADALENDGDDGAADDDEADPLTADGRPAADRDDRFAAEMKLLVMHEMEARMTVSDDFARQQAERRSRLTERLAARAETRESRVAVNEEKQWRSKFAEYQAAKAAKLGEPRRPAASAKTSEPRPQRADAPEQLEPRRPDAEREGEARPRAGVVATAPAAPLDAPDDVPLDAAIEAAIEAVGGEGVAKGKDREKRGSFAKLHKRLRAAWALEGGASAYGDATSVRFAVGQRLRLSVDAGFVLCEVVRSPGGAEGSVHGVSVVGTAGDSRDVDLTKSVWKCDAAPTPLPRSLGTPGPGTRPSRPSAQRFPSRSSSGPRRRTRGPRTPAGHRLRTTWRSARRFGWPLAPAARRAYFTLAGISQADLGRAAPRRGPLGGPGFYLLVRDVDGRRVAVGEVAGAAYKDARFYNTKAVLRSSDWLEDLSIAYAAKKRQPARVSTWPGFAVDVVSVRSATRVARGDDGTWVDSDAARGDLRAAPRRGRQQEQAPKGLEQHLKQLLASTFPAVDDADVRSSPRRASGAAAHARLRAGPPRNATPAPSHARARAAARVLDPATRLREDALVVSAAGGGRPAVVRFEDRDEDEPVDLNAFNHSVAHVARTSCPRSASRCAVALENEFVEDAITGKHLHALRQTLHIGLAERDGVGGVAASATATRRSSDLVALLTEPQQGDGSAGEAAAQPVLIMAEAGTGKSWMTKQIACAAAKAVQTGDPAGQFYPLVIYVQELAHLIRSRRDEVAEGSAFVHLVEAFIRIKFGDQPAALRKLDAEAQALAIRQQVEDNEYFQRLAAFAEVRLRHDALWGHVPEDQQERGKAGEPRRLLPARRPSRSRGAPAGLGGALVARRDAPAASATLRGLDDRLALLACARPPPGAAYDHRQEWADETVEELAAEAGGADGGGLWREIIAECDELLAVAERLRAPSRRALEELAEALNLPKPSGRETDRVRLGPLKKPVRIYAKAHDEREGYEGYYDDGGLATANVVDVLRATLLFDDAPSRAPCPLLCNVRVRESSDGVELSQIAEIQLHLSAIASWDKESRAHEHYEYFRRELSGAGLGSNLEDFLDKTMSVYASICETPVLSTALSGDATLVDAWDFMMRDGAPPLVKVIVSPDPAPGPGGVPHAHGGQFQFKHQSLQEFFVAEDLRMALVNGETHGAFTRDEPGWTNFLVARAFSQEYFKSTSRVHTTVPIGHLSNILAIAADLADVSDLLLGGREVAIPVGRLDGGEPPHLFLILAGCRIGPRSLDLRGHGSGLKSTLKFVSRCAGLEELRLGGTSVCGTLRHLSGLGALRVLDLDGTLVQNSLRPLEDCRALVELRIRDARLGKLETLAIFLTVVEIPEGYAPRKLAADVEKATVAKTAKGLKGTAKDVGRREDANANRVTLLKVHVREAQHLIGRFEEGKRQNLNGAARFALVREKLKKRMMALPGTAPSNRSGGPRRTRINVC